MNDTTVNPPLFSLVNTFKFRRGLYATFIELLSLENPLYAQKEKKGRNSFRNITAATYRLAKRNAKAADGTATKRSITQG